MNILLTGGAGFIGSHVAVVMTEAGHQVTILDNFCNSYPSVLLRLKKILGRDILCVEGDVRDTTFVKKALQDYKIDAVMHFAGLKAVDESIQKPLDFFDNNVAGTTSLLKAMCESNIKTLIFSSSATVYGAPKYLPLDESHSTRATNPYGRSKLHIEEILADIVASDSSWQITCLRYFNPVGAHESGLIGDDPNGVPNNLMPYMVRVAVGQLPHLNIYGNDYNTPDGTGVRDYIHVMDLAEGHLAALSFIKYKSGLHVFNLGTGKGNSVLEMVKTFESVSGRPIPLKIAARRAGDVASCYAKVDKASHYLGWKATRNLQKMCASTWNFQKNTYKCNNP